jgi:hypothetical protein
MDARQMIWKAAKLKKSIELFIDARMGAEILRLYTLRPTDLDACEFFESNLYASDEAEQLPCSARSIIYCPAVAGALIAAQVKAFAFSDVKIEQARKVLIGYFDPIEKLKGLRDTGIITPYADKPPLLITGGLSWGDSPTDSSEPINSLAEVPGVYEMFERWAVEDQRENPGEDHCGGNAL